jgi:transcriptional regulator with XRE-family HTH domain
MDIGNKIQRIRADQGMTQAEFADKFHVSRQTVSNWENNKNYPDLSILRSISDEYAISFDTLLKDDVEYISHIDNANDRAIKATRWLRIVVPVAIILLVIDLIMSIIGKIFGFSWKKVLMTAAAIFGILWLRDYLRKRKEQAKKDIEQELTEKDFEIINEE